PLVSVLFERGAATAADSQAIALAVALYGIGLPAFVLQKILQPLYFAREDTRSPFRYALAAMTVNAVLAIGLAPWLGWTAPAIATSAAGWWMALLLARGAQGMGDVARFDDRFRRRIVRICIAAAVMGLASWAAAWAMTDLLRAPGWRYLALLGLVLLSMVVYFGFGQLIGAFRIAEFRAALRRRSRVAKADS
ncbi:MAG: polysaccharide biosynthesis C-terminal domain-containing protein, partial [Pseudooceanicola sp.]|nr:polysaccharide biosynthesis C-terminal domain-containing protein [Pseudooceanicola sp.]